MTERFRQNASGALPVRSSAGATAASSSAATSAGGGTDRQAPRSARATMRPRRSAVSGAPMDRA
jgi:hypothetical protein